MNTYIKKLFNILNRDQKKSLSIILFLSLLFGLFEILSLGLIIPVLKIFTNNDIQQLKENFYFIQNLSEIKILIFVLIIFLFVYLIKIIISVILINYNNKFKKKLLEYISKKLLSNYLNNRIDKLIGINSSYLIRNIWNETNLFSYGLISNITSLVTELIIFLSVSFVLFFYNFKISLFLLIYFSLIGSFLYFKNSDKLKKFGDIRVEYNALILKELRQSFGNIKDIFLYRLQNFFLKSFTEKVSVISTSTEKRDNIILLPRQYIEFLSVISIIIIIFIGLYLNNALSEIFVLIGLYVFASLRLMPGVVKILNNFQKIRYNLPLINLLNGELKRKEDQKHDLNFENQNKFFFNELYLKNLSFNYARENFICKNQDINQKNEQIEILKDINLKIKKAEKIGILGKSGSGKTTLVNIISGFLKQKSGEVFVNGQNDNVSKILFEKSIGYVQQSTYIADETIKFNITLKKDNDEINKNYLNKILKMLNLENVISKFPDGIETLMGEKGSQFSGGQNQRIGIARAIYRNPDFLILDEATNALDIETQNQILKNIFKEMKNKTIIVISHQLENLSFCEKKYFLDNKILRKLEN